MESRAKVDNISHIVNLIIIRFSIVGLYVAAFKGLERIKSNLFLIPQNPLIFFHFFESVKSRKIFHDAYLRSFIIIILCIFVFLPIFKTLTAEIATDTIWLNFLICQIVYCVGSVRSSILESGYAEPEYSRKCVIPLEESLLISKKVEKGREVSSIASVIGFILVFSRIKANFDVVYLQTIGFILYFFFPWVIESKRMFCSNILTATLFVMTVLLTYLANPMICFIFVVVSSFVLCALKLLIKFI